MDGSKLEKHYFISYSHNDLDIAKQLKQELEESGFEIWMDESAIVKGTIWDVLIDENIKQSIAVLYLASPASRFSSVVLHELELAKICKKGIIPIWVRGDTEWAKVVAFGHFTRQYIDIREEYYENGIGELIQTLNNPLDYEARFKSYLRGDDNDGGSQKAEDIKNQPPSNQMPDKEKEMPEDTNRIDQPLQVEKHPRIVSLLRFVFTVCKNLLYPSSKPDNQKNINSTSTMHPPSDQSSNPINPYKGLHAFEYEDEWSFFGRENLIHEMVEQVRGILNNERQYSQVPCCMMIVGASGSGKSSVVMAGLLPALERNIPEVKRWFFLSPVRPGEDPMNALAQALKLPFLNEENVGDSPLKTWKRAKLRKKLDEPDSRGLNELLPEITHNPDDRIVLIVDQFEEIFAPTVNSEQREQFINLLMATATEPDTPMLLLFTLRADFYNRVLDHETLYHQVEQHLINIPPMTREELRAVIEKPVQHPDVNVTFDPNLAEDLLYEVRKRPESLPLLQFTLEQLFELREGRRLTRQGYDEIGGLQGAINKHAEATYDELPTSEHQTEARKLFTEFFINIAESHGETSHLESGEGITRRRVTQAELEWNDLNIRSETINAFVDARLLTIISTVRQSTDLENITGIAYEISHEALISAWERFRQWIEEDRKDIYLVQSLRPQIKQWSQAENRKKKKPYLVEKLTLQQLQEYKQRKKLDPLPEEFLKASLAQRTYQRIRISLLVTALVILSLVLGPIIRNVIAPDPTIVTSLADSGLGTLPYVLQKASDEATITFDPRLNGQTISLAHGSLDINKSLTIHGPAGGINITSGTTGNYIAIEPGHDVTLDNMTFTNSYPREHSIIMNAGNLTINKSNLNGNKSYSDGGAIHNTGSLILKSDIINNNTVTDNGGAIYNIFGTVSINNSTISDNEAYANGGGIYSLGGVVTVNGSRIVNNRADSNAGGGIDMVNV